MPRRGKGVPVAEGIWRYQNGYRVTTKVHGDQKEKWFHGPHDPLKLVAFRANWELERRTGKPLKAEDAFATAAAEFLTTFPEGERRTVDVTIHLTHWLTAFPDLALADLTPERIQTQLARWKAAGAAQSTLRHRRRELGNFFTWKYGLEGINPVRAVPRPKKDKHKRRRDFPYVVGRLILFQMAPSVTKLRLRVMLETGWPHAILAAIETRDVHLKATPPHVYIAPRGKGEGVEGREIPVSRRAVAALRAFVKADAFGPFSTSGMRSMFLVARDRARRLWEASREAPWPAPDDLHPYDLRHAFIARTVREHGIEAASYLAIHSDIRQTQEYDVERALYDRAVAAMDDA